MGEGLRGKEILERKDLKEVRERAVGYPRSPVGGENSMCKDPEGEVFVEEGEARVGRAEWS